MPDGQSGTVSSLGQARSKEQHSRAAVQRSREVALLVCAWSDDLGLLPRRIHIAPILGLVRDNVAFHKSERMKAVITVKGAALL
jgi:hypothetical protein